MVCFTHRLTWPLAFLLLASCGESSTQQPMPIPSPPSNGSEWSILSGIPVFIDAAGRSYFTFGTVPSPAVNYLTRPVDNVSGSISMSYTITTTGAPVFDYRTNPNNTCGPGFPGTVRLFIQRQGDDMSAVGPMAQYRYWSADGVATLAPGSTTLTATLEPSRWTDVSGKSGAELPAAFADALRYAGRVGVTFGGGCFAGHGVFVTGGTATFTINQ